MIQDIEPKTYGVAYEACGIQKEDTLLLFLGDRVFVYRGDDGRIRLPCYGQLQQVLDLPQTGEDEEIFQYLFSIDDMKYFCMRGIEAQIKKDTEGYEYVKVRALRELAERPDCFAVSTGYQLYTWYRDHRYCGRCGGRLKAGETERTLFCPECRNMIYPRIAPAVIVAVTDGERILLTKYAGREYKKYALIAGFCEIGETAEDTVRREVMEEVGLRVKNIRYYKSQPWGFDSNLLFGYFAQLDGADGIRMEEEELAVAEWKDRKEILDMDDGISLTREMMNVFAKGKERGRFLDSYRKNGIS